MRVGETRVVEKEAEPAIPVALLEEVLEGGGVRGVALPRGGEVKREGPDLDRAWGVGVTLGETGREGFELRGGAADEDEAHVLGGELLRQS